MDERTADKLIAATHRMRSAAYFALIMLGVFLVFAAAGEIKQLRYIGSGITASDTITVSGEGKVFAVPDVAEFSVTVQESAKDVKSAQDSATTKANAIIDYLKGAGIDAKDIQTSDYSVSPQYQYQNAACPVMAPSGGAGSNVVYCPPGRQTLTGYQVSQTLDVKVRDTSKAGDILAGVGSKGASQVSGLNFTIEDQSAVEAQARDKAIADAKAKAQVLAKSLGVSIVRIVNFSENGNQPMPYFAKASAGMALDSAAVAPQIPVGQNTILSDVSITYEIQ
ncbi:MAG TPA: SIMPL domain-containing protein [Candidatus Paceibacterota bacterium]|nr:SIMPL domain-containing protein [Candidatus Paceibacterota bacterium]